MEGGPDALGSIDVVCFRLLQPSRCDNYSLSCSFFIGYPLLGNTMGWIGEGDAVYIYLSLCAWTPLLLFGLEHIHQERVIYTFYITTTSSP